MNDRLDLRWWAVAIAAGSLVWAGLITWLVTR